MSRSKLFLVLCAQFVLIWSQGAYANSTLFDKGIERCNRKFETEGLKYDYLASLYLAVGDPKKVIENCDIALRIKPDASLGPSVASDVMAKAIIMKSLAQMMLAQTPTELPTAEARIGRDCWLTPVTAYLMGQRQESEFITAANSDPFAAGVSEAFFYLGIKKLLEKNVPFAKKYLAQAADSPSDTWFSDSARICLEEIDPTFKTERPAPTELPKELLEAETSNISTLGKWVLQPGGQYESNWGNGAKAVLKVTKFTGTQLNLYRTDTGSTAGFTANYTGTWDARRKRYIGNVNWMPEGQTTFGDWRACVVR